MRAGTVDLLFANEVELRSLYQTADFDSALAALRREARLAVVTRSEKGCVVVSRDQLLAVPACPVEHVVDTTGAGDLFAAGFFFRLRPGAPPRGAGRKSNHTPPPPPRWHQAARGGEGASPPRPERPRSPALLWPRPGPGGARPPPAGPRRPAPPPPAMTAAASQLDGAASAKPSI